MKKNLFLILIAIAIPTLLLAQGGPGMGRQFDPAQMVAAEKKLLLDSVQGLNDDQKLIINAIYEDYESAFTKARGNANPDNREAMRESMMKIRDEKSEALQAVLTEEQYKAFDEILKRRREQAQQRRRRDRNE